LVRVITTRLGTEATVSVAATANAQQAQINELEGYHQMISRMLAALSPFARNEAKNAKPKSQATAAAAIIIDA
jgi:hypothetical protein